MVVGITGVKVASSYVGTVPFDDPDHVVRWLALSNGLALPRRRDRRPPVAARRLGSFRMKDVNRTTVVTIVTSAAVTAAVWSDG